MGLFCVSGLTKLVFHRRHVSCFLPAALAHSTWGCQDGRNLERLADIWAREHPSRVEDRGSRRPYQLPPPPRGRSFAVRYERVCQADGETVPWNEIVKGYEYEKGKFVVLTDADFKTKMKRKKPKLEEQEGETPDSGVLDLMSRLRASLEEGSGKKGAIRAKRKAVTAGRKSAKPKKRQIA